MAKLYISSGHGGIDPGAVANGTTEYQMCSKIARQLVIDLRLEGVDAVLVPLGLSLRDRISWVNKNTGNQDYLIELHMNAATPAATGAEGFYYTGSTLGEERCLEFMQNYVNNIGLKLRKVAGDTTARFGRLGIVRDTAPMAFLIELGFLTNKSDLEAVRKDGGEALKVACAKMMGINPKPPEVSDWAKASVEKARKKGVAVVWDDPQQIIANNIVEHLFKNLGIFNTVTGDGVSKERFIVALDRLGLLD